jgi:hypothetical protein
MWNALLVALLSCLWLGALYLMLPRFDASERPWLVLALAMHMLGSSAQVLVVATVYGGGDSTGYHAYGLMIAELIRSDPLDAGWQTIVAVSGLREVPLSVPIPRTTTGAMTGISALISVLVGDSIYASSAFIAGFSFFGELALYRTLRRELALGFRRPLIVAVLMVPSVVFWSGGLFKEAIAIAGLGYCVWGAHDLGTRRYIMRGALFALLGAWITVAVKPYVIIPFGIAAGVFILMDGHRPLHLRRIRRLRPGALIVGTAVALGVLLAVGRAFPRFDPANLAEEAANMQGVAELTEGGSNYSLGRGSTGSILNQLSFAPVALFTSLLRPLLVEARSVTTAINSVETSIVLLMIVRAWLKNGLRGLGRLVTRSPAIAFCLVYTLALGLGVGLGTTNLGTLSRYRMPLMPFYATVLLAWWREPREGDALETRSSSALPR